MDEEWSSDADVVSNRLGSSSWNSSRLVATAGVVALSTLVVGLGLANLFAPSTVGAVDSVPTAVAGAVLEPPETDIAEAVAVTREGSFEPAPSEHLTVVRVSVSVCGFRSSGSGVVVADGLLLTAAHVVGDAQLVRIDHRGTSVTGEVLGVLGDGRDIALVAVDAPLAVPVASAGIPAVGAPLTLIGHPDGGPLTSSVGPVVEIAPVVARLAGGSDIHGIDVPTTQGISGGPAVDENGAVVGLVVARETATDTALVLALPDLAEIGSAALTPGECPGNA